MEDRLNLNSMLPLQEMAFRSISVALCNKPRLFSKIATLNIEEYNSIKWSCYIDIERDLSTLRLPKLLKRQMTPIIRAVWDEIIRWRYLHEEYFSGDLCVRALKHLRWTADGTINYQRTAEELVLSPDELLDASRCLEFASFYCLEDCIPTLWRELPEANKKTYCVGDVSQIKNPHLQMFLPNILQTVKSRLRKNLSFDYLDAAPSSNAFVFASLVGNKSLFDYYSAGLTEEEKEATIGGTARHAMKFRCSLRYCSQKTDIERYLLSSVSCHLLSLMTAEEQMRLLNELPCEAFSCFLDWQRKDLFLDIADLMWTLIPESKYEDMLRALHDGIVIRGHYFPNLLQEFFQRSPLEFRKHFVDSECKNSWFFRKFARNDDAETIKVVMRSLDPFDRVRMIFSQGGLSLIYRMSGRWTCMEAFLLGATLSKEEKHRLKKAFITEYAIIRTQIPKFERILEFLDIGEQENLG